MDDCIGKEIVEEADYIKDLVNRLERYSKSYYELGRIALEVERIGYEVMVYSGEGYKNWIKKYF